MARRLVCPASDAVLVLAHGDPRPIRALRDPVPWRIVPRTERVSSPEFRRTPRLMRQAEASPLRRAFG